jgi:hypothetical protein
VCPLAFISSGCVHPETGSTTTSISPSEATRVVFHKNAMSHVILHHAGRRSFKSEAVFLHRETPPWTGVLASCRSPRYANPNAKDEVQSSIVPSMLLRTTDAPSRCLCHSASEISDYDGCMISDQTKHNARLTVEYASDNAENKRRMLHVG